MSLSTTFSTIRTGFRRTGSRRLPEWEVLVSAAFLLILLVAAVFPSLLAPGDPLRANFGNALSPPSWSNPLGADHLGRDIYTRIVHGAQYSLFIGVSSTALGVSLGIVFGLLAGVGHRLVNELISRVFDVVGAFPDLLFALVLITFTGPGMWNLIFAIGVASAPRYGRVIRAETLAIREAGYVQQSRLSVASPLVITLRHILPNALGTVPVLATLGIGSAILGAAGLSFLGFGPQQPAPEWGAMLTDARNDLRIAWWAGVFPGLIITATVVAVTVVGRYLQRNFEGRSAQ